MTSAISLEIHISLWINDDFEVASAAKVDDPNRIWAYLARAYFLTPYQAESVGA